MILVVIIMTVIVFENTVTVDVTGIFKVSSVNIVITQPERSITKSCTNAASGLLHTSQLSCGLPAKLIAGEMREKLGGVGEGGGGG